MNDKSSNNGGIKIKRVFYTFVVKRFLDIIISGVAIIVLFPLFILIFLLELVFHGWPVFFIQERPGLNGKIFKLVKFRSMNNKTDSNGKLLPSNERVTKFGKIIRKYSLDELPELFCVFIGKMSIIGPRPLKVEYLPLYNNRHKMRHKVRPGLACVRLKPGDTWTWRDQFDNDIWYIENCSFLLDFKMIFAVAREALHPSNCRVEATRKAFDGNNLDE